MWKNSSDRMERGQQQQHQAKEQWDTRASEEAATCGGRSNYARRRSNDARRSRSDVRRRRCNVLRLRSERQGRADQQQQAKRAKATGVVMKVLIMTMIAMFSLLLRARGDGETKQKKLLRRKR